jgi:hypothetical protein
LGKIDKREVNWYRIMTESEHLQIAQRSDVTVLPEPPLTPDLPENTPTAAVRPKGLTPAIINRTIGLVLGGTVLAFLVVAIFDSQSSMKNDAIDPSAPKITQTLPSVPVAPTPTPIVPEQLQKIQIEGSVNVVLSSGEVGTIKYIVNASYPAKENNQSAMDKVTIANAIQDNLSQISSTQLAQSKATRKKILAKLPNYINSINLEPSKELLEGFKHQKQAVSTSMDRPFPSLNIQPIKSKAHQKHK